MQSGLNFIWRNGSSSRGERLMICHAPAESEEEQSALRTFIEEVALARTDCPVKILSDDARRSANPPDHPPQVLVQHLRAFGIELNDTVWAHSTTTSATP